MKQLKALAKERGITGYSSLLKRDLISLIESNNQVICYSGMGSNPSGVHSEKEFLRAMKKVGCTSNCPKSVQGWLEWSGAKLTTPSYCYTMLQRSK